MTKKERIRRLAIALAPNFYRSVKWNQDIFLQWAERILETKKNPYCDIACKYNKKHNSFCKSISTFL